MTALRSAWLAAAASLLAFAGAAFWRLDAAYGPLRLSPRPEDWQVLWELFRAGQVDAGVVAQAAGLGLAAAAVPWLLRSRAARRR